MITQKHRTEGSSPPSEIIVISPLRVITERCLVSRRTRNETTCEICEDSEFEATAMNMVKPEGVYTYVSIVPNSYVVT